MLKQALILIVLFYILALLQTSFFPYFLPWSNFILLAVILLNLFERPAQGLGIVAALAGGFLLDVFSGRVMGFYIVSLLACAIFLKAVLKRYIRFPASIKL